MLALWGGLFTQVSVIVLLAGMSGVTQQAPGTVVAAYFIVMGIYFAIDIVWVMGLEMRLLNYFFDANAFERPSLQRVVLLPTFFLFAAAANTFVVILPTLDAYPDPFFVNYWEVAFRAFLLGWFAYGNLALVQAWSYRGYPLEIVGLMPLSGGALSCFSSPLTVLICEQLR